MATPEYRLTYGKLVNYILDAREERLSKTVTGSHFYQNFLDFSITLSQIAFCVSYMHYMADASAQALVQT